MTPVALVEPVAVGTLPLWPSGEPEGDPVEVEPTAVDGTLEAAVESAWGALGAGFATACLLCGGAVHPRWSAGAGVVGGRCEDCGTVLE